MVRAAVGDGCDLEGGVIVAVSLALSDGVLSENNQSSVDEVLADDLILWRGLRKASMPAEEKYGAMRFVQAVR